MQTPEEVKKEHIRKLGNELGILFHQLWNEVAILYSKWNEYVELYGTNPERIDLLNEASPFFFMIIEDSLWESIILHITRITDPANSFGKENLSIRRLITLVDKEIEEKIKHQIDEAILKSEFCRDWRNRFLAHKDLQLALKKAKPLKPASRAKVKEALVSIEKVLSIISEHYMDSGLDFSIVNEPSGAASLIYIIDDGLEAEKKRKKRLQEGKILPEDLEKKYL
jgi:hypothetical protein